jgi:hypothetical protein
MRNLCHGLAIIGAVLIANAVEARPPNPAEYDQVKAISNQFQNDVAFVYNQARGVANGMNPTEMQALNAFYNFAVEARNFNQFVQYPPTQAEQTEDPLRNLNRTFKVAQDLFPALTGFQFYRGNYILLQQELQSMSTMYDVVSPRLWNPNEVMDTARSAIQSFTMVREQMAREATNEEQQAVISNLTHIETILLNLMMQVQTYPASPYYSQGIFNELQTNMGDVKEDLAVANFSSNTTAQFWSASKNADNLQAYY